MLSQNIIVEPIRCIPTFQKRFEIVERKGLGHPDTICDLVMNEISIELSKLYIKETGSVQHHNMDKALLVAGQSEIKYGGGKITKPMKFILGDRATFEINGQKLPIENFAVDTARIWFEKNLRFVKEEHVNYQVEIGTTSKELQSVFNKPETFASNDTSALVGYAPLTPTENAILQIEKFINSKEFKNEFPESGEDVKIMGFRNNNYLDITAAIAFVDSYIDSSKKYTMKKQEMIQSINEYQKGKNDFEIHTSINCLDDDTKGIDGQYLTVLGTSAENADSGQVGRGNMPNGLISPSRPVGAEATAGKNPVSHIGKIYNILSFQLADEIIHQLNSLDEVFVLMYNVIGNAVNKPKAIIVQPITKNNNELEKTEKNKINEIVEKKFEKLDDLCNDLILGKIPIM